MSSEHLDDQRKTISSVNRDSTSYLLGRLFKKQPWGTTAFLLIAGTGIASLFGLPSRLSWGVIIWGLLAILIVSEIQHERSKKAAPDYKPAKSMWTGWWSVCTAIAIIVGGLTGQSFFPSQEQSQKRKATYDSASKLMTMPGEKTEQYWKATVFKLHNLRFPQPTNEQETSGAFVRQLHEELSSAVEEARQFQSRNTSAAFVDDELKELVERHLQIDELCLNVLQEAMMLAKQRDLPVDQASVKERIEQGNTDIERILSSQMTISQYANKYSMPQDLAKKILRIELLRVEQLEEIKAMQNRLQQVYSEKQFLLPQ